MIEVEPIDRKQDLVCQPMALFPVLLRRVRLNLQLRFTNDAATVQSVASAQERAEHLFTATL